MLYDFSKMNIEQTKNALEGNYDTHNIKIHDMLKRVRITRRVLSILFVHPDWNENEVFSKVQDSFRKGSGSEIIRAIDRELYDYFKQNWLDIIKLDPITRSRIPIMSCKIPPGTPETSNTESVFSPIHNSKRSLISFVTFPSLSGMKPSGL